MKNTEEFRKALEHKNLPLLVLDQKWHRLFAIHGKTAVHVAHDGVHIIFVDSFQLTAGLQDKAG